MTEVQLLGNTDDTHSGVAAANYFWGNQWQAGKSGTLKHIRAVANLVCHGKFAIYADNAGEPAARLAQVGDTALTLGVNLIAISDVIIVAGTYYWLAVNQDTASGTKGQSGGASRIKNGTYSSYTFPDPAGTGYTSHTIVQSLSGWGNEAVIPVLESQYRKRRS